MGPRLGDKLRFNGLCGSSAAPPRGFGDRLPCRSGGTTSRARADAGRTGKRGAPRPKQLWGDAASRGTRIERADRADCGRVVGRDRATLPGSAKATESASHCGQCSRMLCISSTYTLIGATQSYGRPDLALAGRALAGRQDAALYIGLAGLGGHVVALAGRSLGGRALAGRALVGRALAGRELAARALASGSLPKRSRLGQSRALAGRALAGRALAGRALAGRALAGRCLPRSASCAAARGPGGASCAASLPNIASPRLSPPSGGPPPDGEDARTDVLSGRTGRGTLSYMSLPRNAVDGVGGRALRGIAVGRAQAGFGVGSRCAGAGAGAEAGDGSPARNNGTN